MTAMIGASVLLVAGSAVALALGWGNANESLLFTSIGSSVLAGALLIAVWVTGKRKTSGKSVEPVQAAGDGAAQTSKPLVMTPPPPPAPAKERLEVVKSEKVERVEAPDDVIAIPDRKRFHRPECRYAGAKGAERMSKASARRRAYTACGICKP